jgi:hypothetical protein
MCSEASSPSFAYYRYYAHTLITDGLKSHIPANTLVIDTIKKHNFGTQCTKASNVEVLIVFFR